MIFMLKKVCILCLLLALSGVSLSAQVKTEILDAKAKAMLLGRHKISLQWISWDYFGTATVTQKNGTFYLKGSQRGRGNGKGDFLNVDGVITSIDSKEFKFKGKIVTRISHINNGEPCTREGEMSFKITGKRRYWRLQEMDNPCDEATDYVDIYFR